MDNKYMPYKNNTIKFLERIASECDTRASDMVDTAKNKSMEDGIDALVWSSFIMNVHNMCKLMIKQASKDD